MRLKLYKPQVGSGRKALSGKIVPEHWLITQKWEKALFEGRFICYDMLNVLFVNAGVSLLLP